MAENVENKTTKLRGDYPVSIHNHIDKIIKYVESLNSIGENKDLIMERLTQYHERLVQIFIKFRNMLTSSKSERQGALNEENYSVLVRLKNLMNEIQHDSLLKETILDELSKIEKSMIGFGLAFEDMSEPEEE
jgi:hypothetical protein